MVHLWRQAPTLLLATQKKVAISWGIKINYTTLGCEGTNTDITNELEKKNKVVYQFLENKFGADWKKKFDKEVDKEMKIKSKKHK